MRSLVGVTLLVGVPLLGLLPLCFLNPKACALLCNVFVQSRQFHAKFVCLFFHVKFLTILASIVGYDKRDLRPAQQEEEAGLAQGKLRRQLRTGRALLALGLRGGRVPAQAAVWHGIL